VQERNEAALLLEEGAREIRDLRRENEVLGVQVETFNKCFAMLQTPIIAHTCCGQDRNLADKMERKARELDGPGPQPGN